jgi:hypothetical protein
MYATQTDKALGATLCGCETTPEDGCADDLPETSLATLMFLAEEDIASLNTCIMTMGCGAESACTSQTPLSAALACAD